MKQDLINSVKDSIKTYTEEELRLGLKVELLREEVEKKDGRLFSLKNQRESLEIALKHLEEAREKEVKTEKPEFYQGPLSPREVKAAYKYPKKSCQEIREIARQEQEKMEGGAYICTCGHWGFNIFDGEIACLGCGKKYPLKRFFRYGGTINYIIDRPKAFNEKIVKED